MSLFDLTESTIELVLDGVEQVLLDTVENIVENISDGAEKLLDFLFE